MHAWTGEVRLRWLRGQRRDDDWQPASIRDPRTKVPTGADLAKDALLVMMLVPAAVQGEHAARYLRRR